LWWSAAGRSNPGAWRVADTWIAGRTSPCIGPALRVDEAAARNAVQIAAATPSVPRPRRGVGKGARVGKGKSHGWDDAGRGVPVGERRSVRRSGTEGVLDF
jgi:hypothetical protein